MRTPKTKKDALRMLRKKFLRTPKSAADMVSPERCPLCKFAGFKGRDGEAVENLVACTVCYATFNDTLPGMTRPDPDKGCKFDPPCGGVEFDDTEYMWFIKNAYDADFEDVAEKFADFAAELAEHLEEVLEDMDDET